jgi:nucleotide-binding universal stress UspA family protein
MTEIPGLIVIGYDGSTDARRAARSARLLDADRALVVNVWQPGIAADTAPAPMGAEPVLPSPGEEERLESAARRTAEEGTALAREAGVAGEPVVLRGASAGEIGKLLARLAEERGATAIVVGRRGISRLAAIVLGSVSDATVREAHCPVLVVPAPDDH